MFKQDFRHCHKLHESRLLIKKQKAAGLARLGFTKKDTKWAQAPSPLHPKHTGMSVSHGGGAFRQE